ncbi:hypothetical protein IP92_02113 [Pseudoduganella flava]|uniref:Gel scht n=1 Tax=Pseudoduganella flava TaxID=871742 RepID=A0A562PW88_9BURK|nr:hypothetical protein [Pseudoduganella flava]QGZ39802.1 hypothetical protein GO485_12565 [Pseudoduganella flava]TWI48721.1 hypothetical protein IP92_02113 [Pseudoduganella flava]
MKNSFISASAAVSILVAALVPAAAHAQNDAPTVPVKAARTATTATTASTYAMQANEFADYANTYRLSNGQVAKFTQQGNHYFVQLKSSLAALQRDESKGPVGISTKLRPIGPGQFVTDSGTQLQFRNDGEEVVIDNFERLPAAKVAASQVNVQMIARR